MSAEKEILVDGAFKGVWLVRPECVCLDDLRGAVSAGQIGIVRVRGGADGPKLDDVLRFIPAPQNGDV